MNPDATTPGVGWPLAAAALETISDPVLAADNQLTITYANAAAERLFRRDGVDLHAQPLAACLEASCGEAMYHRFAAAHADGAMRDFEAYCPPINLWLNVHIYPSQGGVFAFFHDITERKRTERRLYQTQQTLEVVFMAAPLAVIAIDVDDRVLMWNPAAERIFGWTADEIVGHPYPLVPQSLIAEYCEHTAALARGEGCVEKETLRLRKDGTMVPVSISTAPLVQPNGSIRGYMTLFSDITERKRAAEALARSETRYRQIVETTDQGIWVTDQQGVTTFVNQRMAQMLDHAPERLLGRPFTEFVDAADSEGKAAMARAEEARPWDVRLRRRDGTVVQTLVSTNTIRDDAGGLTGRLSMVTDVTERRMLEEQLLQAQKLDSIGRLAGGVAHDFNNLLTAINGYTELAQRELSPSCAPYEYLSHTLRAVERAAGVTRQLLAFARKQIVEPKVVGVNALMQDLSKLLRPLIGEHIHLRLCAEAQPDTVRVDPGQLEQVVLNLALNARDAMPGGGFLTILTDNTNEGATVRIRVSDTGVGMSPETQARIFEPFYTTKEQGKGVGLGLASAYGIIQQNGGIISVDSRLGDGAVFSIELPFLAEPAPAEASPETPAHKSGEGETILLVEDEMPVRQMTAGVLRAAGYNVVEAPHPAEALRLARAGRESIGMLLTDIVMPEMSGRELVQRMRSHGWMGRVLFVSGYSEDIIAHHGVLDADIHFLGKPYSPDALVQKIRAVLDAP